MANTSLAKGGAIYYELSGNNYSSLNSKINNSEFTNNKAVANSVDGVSNAEGGAIYNADHSNYSYVNGLVGIASIKGNFAKNSANAVSTNGNATASGGALYSEGIYGSYHNSVADIISNFTDNIANAVSGTKTALARGGAVINLNKIGNIVGNFEGNKASASSNTGQAIAQGGALYSNYANDSYSGPKGIKSIKGDFIKNSATAISADSTSIATGGAIYGSYDGTITDVTSNFVENIVAATSKSAKANTSAYAYGGAVSTMVDKSNYGYSYSGKISNITGDFTGNSAIAKSNAGTAEAKGGAIYHKRAESNDYYKPMSLIDTNFINNKAEATEMICGDITNDIIRSEIINKSKQYDINFIIATPPCQGMSEAGKRLEFDERNQLIYYAMDVIKKIKPDYVFLENVPRQLHTKILINGEEVTIPEYIKRELSNDYVFNNETLIKAMDHGVPQMRERNIFLLVKKDLGIQWRFPPKKDIITMEQAIGHLPSLDPFLREGLEFTIEKFPEFLKKKEKALTVSKWHYPPTHSWKQVEWMMHTPSGTNAFNKIV